MSLLTRVLNLCGVIFTVACAPRIGKLPDGNNEELVVFRAYSDIRYPDGKFWLEIQYQDDQMSIEFCRVFSDLVFIQTQLSKNVSFVDITPEEMFNYLEDCNQTSSRRDHHRSFLTAFYAMFTGDFLFFAVVPGTKWCGAGNSARHYEDLGENWTVDLCCRAHDHTVSGEYILANSTSSQHNLTNDQVYTMTRCDRDEQLRKCLQMEGSYTAKIVESIYFDIIGMKCFQRKKPAQCVEYANSLGSLKRCTRYHFDPEGPLMWQIFDPV